MLPMLQMPAWRARSGGFVLPCPASAVQWLKTAPAGKVLADSVGTGTARTPQSGRCYTFDGMGDYVDHSAISLTGDFTVSSWVYRDGDTNYMPWGGGLNSSGASYSGYLWWSDATKWWLRYDGEVGGFDYGATTADNIADQTWTRVTVVRSGTTVKLYFNEVEVYSGTELASGTLTLRVFGYSYNSFYSLAGMMFDHRIYARSLSADEVAYLASHGESGTDPGLTNLEAWFKCDEQAGTTAYDCSGNGNHGTITTGAVSTFHGTSPVVTQDIYSWQNEFGYSDGGGGVYIPRDESDTANDVLGNPLDYSGRVPLPGWVTDSHCLTFNGSTYIDAAYQYTSTKSIAFRIYADSIAATDYVLYLDDTNYITVVAGTITLNGFAGATTAIYVDGSAGSSISATTWHSIVITSDTAFNAGTLPSGGTLRWGGNGTNYFTGRLCDLRLSTAEWSSGDAATYHTESGEDSTLSVAKWWPMAEGSGTECFEVVTGAGASALMVGGGSMDWTNRQDVFHFNANQGFRLASGVYIPALLSGATASGGAALTNPAVNFWNFPESHIDFDPYGVPSLSHVSNDFTPGADDLDDTQWVKVISGVRWNHLVTYSAELSGACLTSATSQFKIVNELNDALLDAFKFSTITWDAGDGRWETDSAVTAYQITDGTAGESSAAFGAAAGKTGNALSVNDDGSGSASCSMTLNTTGDSAYAKSAVRDVFFWYNVTTPATSLGSNEALLVIDSTTTDWTLTYNVTTDKLSVTDGTTTLTDSTALTAGVWYLVSLSWDTAGNAKLRVCPAGGDPSVRRTQTTASWDTATENINGWQTLNTVQADPSYPQVHLMDELLIFAGGHRLQTQAFKHLMRENYVGAGGTF